MLTGKDLDDGRELLAHLCRHSVAGCIRYAHLIGEHAGKEFTYALSGFVIEANSHWLLVTAGHVLNEIDRLSSADGVVIKAQFLMDVFGPAPADPHPIPFEFTSARRALLDDSQSGLDGAIVELNDNHRNLLSFNGIEPAPFLYGAKPPPLDYVRLCVVGFPAERVNNDRIQAQYVPLELIPQEANSVASHDVVAHIKDLSGITDIKGMSGSPIYGVFDDQDGVRKYHLMAIQTSWNGKDRIYGCDMQRFLTELLAAQKSAGIID